MPASEHHKPASRVLLIGLDGATWTLLDPMISSGDLPALASLISGGVKGTLESTIPPVTASAWSSLYTGRSPGRHGVFDFRRRMGSESTKRNWVTPGSIGGPKIWEIAAAQGKSCGLVNLPMTFPPSDINGYTIAGMPVPPARDEIGFPKGLVDEVVRETGGYISDIDLLRGTSPDVTDPETCFRFVNEVGQALESRAKALNYLMDSRPTDLTACVFETPDRLCHLFYKVLMPEESDPPLEPWETELRDRMIDIFKRLDVLTGEIIGRMSSDDLVVVMSDHGFGPLDEILKLNRLLGDLGYLRFKPEVIRRKLGRILPEPIKAPLRALFGGRKTDANGERRAFDPYSLIDWSGTEAYSGGSVEQGVFLNVAGREPHGIVEQGGDYHKIRDELIENLQSATHPVDGKPLFDWVEPRENIYAGEYLESAPDIMFSLREYRAVVGEDAELPLMGPWSQPRAGYHRRSGIIVVNGPMVREGERVQEARIQDIAPTILTCWGLDYDSGMDGRIVKNIFRPGFLDANPPAGRDFGGTESGEGARVCGDDSAEMEDLLKGLGYLN